MLFYAFGSMHSCMFGLPNKNFTGKNLRVGILMLVLMGKQQATHHCEKWE